MNHVGVRENINVGRRSKIYLLDRVGVCYEYYKIKSYDIENDNYSTLSMYNENNDKNKTYSNYNCMMVTNILYMVSIKSSRLSEPYISYMISIKSSRLSEPYVLKKSHYRWLNDEAFENTYWPTFFIHFNSSFFITISLNIAS